VNDSNSAPHVSTRLYTGRMPAECRRARTSCSLAPVRYAMRRSENPSCFAARSVASGMDASGRSRIVRCSAANSDTFSRNHGSTCVSRFSSETVQPSSSASAIRCSRFSLGLPSMRASSSRFRISGRNGRTASSERSALNSDSLNVRPNAITSPTDFIWVFSVTSAPGNFSKANFGIFVTT